jgi:hypothetical protein
MSGIGSTATALLPMSRSDAPLVLTLLLVRVRVVRSRDISIVLFVARARGLMRSLFRSKRALPKMKPAPAELLSESCQIYCRLDVGNDAYRCPPWGRA